MGRFSLAIILFTLMSTQFGFGGTFARYQAGPEIGSPVAVIGQDGSELARVTVNEIVDPFETYDHGYPPARGYRMVLVTISIQGTGAQPFSFNPSSLTLVDDAGYLAVGVYTTVPAETGITLLVAQDVAPGATVTGSLTFQVAVTANLSSVVYWLQSDRAIPLARLGAAIPAIGEAVPIVSNDGSEAGQITILELVEPFDAYDASSPPQRGNHYVLMVVQIDNTGIRPMRVDPSAFQLLDSDGFLTRPSFMSRGEDPLPDLAYTDPFPPGESMTGAIAFQVLSGTTQTSVLYTPSSDRLIDVASAGSAGGGASTSATPDAAAAVPTVATESAASSGDCAGADDWATGTVDRFTAAGEIAGGIQPLDEKTAADAPAIRQAALDIASLSTEQEASSPPPAAEVFNGLAVEYFMGMSLELDFFAEGLENGDVTQQVVALANLGLLEESFSAGGEANAAFDELLEVCQLE